MGERRAVMLGAKAVVQKNREKRRHFFVRIAVGRLGQRQQPRFEVRVHRPRNDRAPAPGCVFDAAHLQGKGDSRRFLVPAVDLKRRRRCQRRIVPLWVMLLPPLLAPRDQRGFSFTHSIPHKGDQVDHHTRAHPAASSMCRHAPTRHTRTLPHPRLHAPASHARLPHRTRARIPPPSRASKPRTPATPHIRARHTPAFTRQRAAHACRFQCGEGIIRGAGWDARPSPAETLEIGLPPFPACAAMHQRDTRALCHTPAFTRQQVAHITSPCRFQCGAGRRPWRKMGRTAFARRDS